MRGIAGLGHRVRAISAITPEKHRPDTPDPAGAPGLEVRRYLLPAYALAARTPPSEAHRAVEREGIRRVLLSWIEERSPDVIVIGRELYVWHVVPMAKSWRIPCVLLVRGHPTRAMLDGTYHADTARELLEHFRQVNLMITPAKHLSEGLRRLGLDRIETVPNAVELTRFTPTPRDPELARELAIGVDDITVLYVSNLTVIKRPLDVVEAAERVARQNPRLVFVIVGDGPLRASMEEACRQKGLADRFRFTGWIDYERMPRVINLADMVVLPSETEGLARVYLETQACARVLLASDIPAAREVVTDGATGFLFGTGDVEALATKILLAAADPTLRATIGRQARERVRAHSLDEAVLAYARLLEGVIREHRARR